MTSGSNPAMLRLKRGWKKILNDKDCRFWLMCLVREQCNAFTVGGTGPSGKEIGLQVYEFAKDVNLKGLFEAEKEFRETMEAEKRWRELQERATEETGEIYES